MSMDEDAMFKALLKNKPKQQAQVPVKKEDKETAPAARPSYSKNSEDAMFQVLLKNKPQQQTQAVPKSTATTEPMKNIPAPQPAYEKEEQVVETRINPTVTPAENPVQIAPSSESMDKLTASVNTIYGLMKTMVIVLVLILFVGIAVLVKLQ